MRHSRRTPLSFSPGIAVVLSLALAVATSGCVGRVEEATQAASHGPEARPILQFAAEAGPSEEATATEYEHGSEKLRLGTPRAFEMKEVNVGSDELGWPALQFEIADAQKEDFRRWTAGLVDHRLAMLVDGKVVTAPIVRTALPAGGIVSFGDQHRTQENVRALADRIRAQSGGSRNR